MAKQGELIDCPGCGMLLSSMLLKCPDCDAPINNGKFSFGGKIKKKPMQTIEEARPEKPHNWEAKKKAAKVKPQKVKISRNDIPLHKLRLSRQEGGKNPWEFSH